MKILLRTSPAGQWNELDPLEFGGPDGEEKLRTLLEKSPNLLTTEGRKPVLFFKACVLIDSNEVDLLGVEEDGTIVMVECKLEANREARRMVVGQILEYAGQLRGTSYDEFEEMLTSGSGLSLANLARQHASERRWSEVDFRAAVEQGLKSGDFRLVIAINGMNDELKGIVEYLKERGGVRLEVLELQQFHDQKSRVEVLVPEMYGLIGRTRSSRPSLNWESFAKDAAQRGLDSKQVEAIREFHDKLRTELGAKIGWGAGKEYGVWFGGRWQFTWGHLLGAYSTGKLWLSVYRGNKTTRTESALQERLRDMAVNKLRLTVDKDSDDTDTLNFDFDWSRKTGLLVESLKAILPPEAPAVAKAS